MKCQLWAYQQDLGISNLTISYGLHAQAATLTKELCICCSKSAKRSHHTSVCNSYSCCGFTQACKSSEHNHRVCKKSILLPCKPCQRKPQATRKSTKPPSCKHSVTMFQANGLTICSWARISFAFDSLFHGRGHDMIWPWHMTIHCLTQSFVDRSP